MNYKKIAEAAGVSVGTVSKAFSYSREISEKTREKIFAIAREAGVLEKYTGAKYEKRVIAVLCPEIVSQHYAEMVTILDSMIKEKGDLMTVAITDFSGKTTAELYRYYEKFSGVDGILVISSDEFLPEKRNIPVVMMGRKPKNSKIDAVEASSEDAIYEAVRYLKKNHRQRIAFIGDPLTAGKQAAYEKALLRCGIPVYHHLIVSSEKRFEEAGYDGVEKLLRLSAPPDALIAAYDYIAIGAVQALKKHGKSVPKDVSVIGMDDIRLSSYLDVPLTTIRPDLRQSCEAALELLYKKIDNRFYFSREKKVVPAALVIRDSVVDIEQEET